MKIAPHVFSAIQEIWLREIGEELTPAKADEYGDKLIALVLAVARYKATLKRA